ncbi:hypothetical protein M752DRAFT_330929 [Aspergillus phoenicis ATCC 13157]|uniref:Uncharacterized protein n=1 Tax=Aspergillus phoenicis ATCC 13157 TaxID=1353007 RepID=A0A370P4L4_ASPPH|nr:hypothetical protein M752DRAFT_330929 [Aspergillus phoenicis ATCC 13157]
MNYCKCAWLGASRQPPSTAMQQQLPASAVLRGSLDPLACLLPLPPPTKDYCGTRYNSSMASGAQRDLHRIASVRDSGHTVGYRFSHRVYPTDKLDHAVNRRLNPYAHAHSQPPASCAWGSEGSTTETKGSNIGVPE